MVVDIVAPPLGGGVVGYLLDEYYGTLPWIMLSCVGLGFIGAVVNTVRLARKLEKENKKNEKDKKD